MRRYHTELHHSSGGRWTTICLALLKTKDVIYQNVRETASSPEADNPMHSSQVPCQKIPLNNVNLIFQGNLKLSATCASGIQIPLPCQLGESA